MEELIYVAAHGAFDASRIALGGGMAVCNALVRAWAQAGRFPITLIAPGEAPSAGITHVRLPETLPDGRPANELVHLSTFGYARFCRDFGAATTAFLAERARHHDPMRTCVLCNDISEGPDFEAVARMGYPIVTLFHVDVVHYFTRFYLRNRSRPDRLTRLYERVCRAGLQPVVPGVLRLVFGKQRDAVAYSRRLVVPSRAMATLLLRCYPLVRPERIAVLPWGALHDRAPAGDVAAEEACIAAEHSLKPDDILLLTMSRISPEKGIHRALEALIRWEQEEDPLLDRIVLAICGDAAFMQGEETLRRLQALAAQLRRVRVLFPGYVAGARKQAWLRRAALYLFLSEHESYGLTLAEALGASLPVLTSDHGSARDLVPEDAGVIVECGSRRQAPERIFEALRGLLQQPERLRLMGEAAASHAPPDFERAACELAGILEGAANLGVDPTAT